MSTKDMTGSLDIEYAKGRDTKKSLRYRLWRRTYEVLTAIEQFAEGPVHDIVDLGTADGRMLDMIQQKYPKARCIGIEYNNELVEFGRSRFPHLQIVHGDIQSLDFPDNSFDIAVATAVIEHVPDPGRAMREIRRTLRPGGILILTSPDPFWEHLATMVGHLKNDQHNEVMNLKQLKNLVQESGFFVVKAQKFMLSPVGMPFEFFIESIFRGLRLDFLMANQLLVARC